MEDIYLFRITKRSIELKEHLQQKGPFGLENQTLAGDESRRSPGGISGDFPG